MSAAAWIVAAAGAVLVAAALLTLVRMTKGPSALDRVVAADVMVAVVVAALALEAGVTRHTTTLPIMVALSLLGFIGSLSLARVLGELREDIGHAPDKPPDIHETHDHPGSARS